MPAQASVRFAPEKLGLDQQGRRREFLPFLAWPFFLSEAFKSLQACGGIAATQDEDGRERGATEQAAAPAQLADEQLVPRHSPEQSFAESNSGGRPAMPSAVADDPSVYSPALAKPFGGAHAGRSTSSPSADGDKSGDKSDDSGASLADVQDDSPTQDGADIHIALGSGALDLEVSAELSPLDVSLNLGPVSVELATVDLIGDPVGTIIDLVLGEEGEPAFQATASSLISTIGGVTGSLPELVEGSMVPNGILSFGENGQAAIALDLWGPTGSYTDYAVALRTGGANRTGSTDMLADVNGHQVTADAVVHASVSMSEPSSSLSPAHAAIDELTLRGAPELIL